MGLRGCKELLMRVELFPEDLEMSSGGDARKDANGGVIGRGLKSGTGELQ